MSTRCITHWNESQAMVQATRMWISRHEIEPEYHTKANIPECSEHASVHRKDNDWRMKWFDILLPPSITRPGEEYIEPPAPAVEEPAKEETKTEVIKGYVCPRCDAAVEENEPQDIRVVFWAEDMAIGNEGEDQYNIPVAQVSPWWRKGTELTVEIAEEIQDQKQNLFFAMDPQKLYSLWLCHNCEEWTDSDEYKFSRCRADLYRCEHDALHKVGDACDC